MPEEAVIGAEDPDQPEVRALLAASDAYSASLYPADSNHLLDVAGLQRPEVSFLVARLDGRAIGCGGLVRHGPEYGEIKRLFVAPAARGRRLGRQLLDAIEAIALQHGLGLVRLETGTKQHAALSLYRAAGYVERSPFGDYGPDPLSIYMEKRLDPLRR
jgi:putative acetyltransferase